MDKKELLNLQNKIKRWAWSQLEHMRRDGPKLTLLYLANKCWGQDAFTLSLSKLAKMRGISEKTLRDHLTTHPLSKIVEYTPGTGHDESHFRLLYQEDLGGSGGTKRTPSTKKVNTSSIVANLEPHWKDIKHPSIPSRNNKLQAAHAFHALCEHGTPEQVVTWWKIYAHNDDPVYRRSLHRRTEEHVVAFQDWLEETKDKEPERDVAWLAARNHKLGLIRNNPTSWDKFSEEEIAEYELQGALDAARSGE